MTNAAIAVGAACLMGVAAGAVAQTAATPSALSADWAAQSRFTIGADALVWWMKDSPVVPAVTNGLLGQPQTQTLLGGQDVSMGASPGVRISGRYAVTDHSALEGNFFYFGSRSKSAGVESSGEVGSTNLLFPYIDANTSQEDVTQLSQAPVYRGGATQTVNNSLLGAEVNGTWQIAPAGKLRMDLLGGVRYLRLREGYSLTTHSPYIAPFGDDIWNTTDKFDTTNDFYGVQAGIRAQYDQRAYFANATAKVAVGAMAQTAGVSGSLVTNDFNNFTSTQTFSGGYFALPTNIGNYSRTAFAVVPEVTLNFGYRITPAATIIVGYSFLYMSNVARPGNQISRTINPSQSTSYTEDPAAHLQGAARPSFKFNDSSFWTQGISVGLQVRF